MESIPLCPKPSTKLSGLLVPLLPDEFLETFGIIVKIEFLLASNFAFV